MTIGEAWVLFAWSDLAGVARGRGVPARTCAGRRKTGINRTMAGPVLMALQSRGDTLAGDDGPYAPESREDYSMPRQHIACGWRQVRVGIRQDLIDSRAGTERCAGISLDAFRDLLSDSAPYRAGFR